MKKFNKRVLAAVFAGVLAVSSVIPAFAADVIVDTTYESGQVIAASYYTNADTEEVAWNTSDGDNYLITEAGVTVSFTNAPFGVTHYDDEENAYFNNWDNFVFETVATDATIGVTMRADAFAWTYGTAANVPTCSVEKSWGDVWDDFQTMCSANTEVTLTATKTSDTTIVFDIAFGTAATETYTVTYSSELTEDVYFHVGASGGTITVNSVDYYPNLIASIDSTTVAMEDGKDNTKDISGFFSFEVSDASTVADEYSIIYALADEASAQYISVSVDGVITALAKTGDDTATVTVSLIDYHGNVIETADVAVSVTAPNHAASVKVSAVSTSLTVGGSVTFTASAVGEDSTVGVTDTVTYAATSSNTSVATVTIDATTGAATISGVAEGTATVTVNALVDNEVVGTDTITVTVTAAAEAETETTEAETETTEAATETTTAATATETDPETTTTAKTSENTSDTFAWSYVILLAGAAAAAVVIAKKKVTE